MSKKQELKMEGGMDIDSAVAYLERLIDGFKSGNVRLEKGAEVLLLHPAGVLEMEIEAAQKKEKEKISIDLSWKRSDFAAAKTSGFVIGNANDDTIDG